MLFSAVTNFYFFLRLASTIISTHHCVKFKVNVNFFCVVMPYPTTLHAIMNLRENYANHLLRTCHKFASGILLPKNTCLDNTNKTKEKVLCN